MSNNQVNKAFEDISKNLGFDDNVSFYAIDPITGNVSLHGATNKRPKAYAGEIIECPWDNPKNTLLQVGETFVVKNDFPAIKEGSANYPQISQEISGVYEIRNARGECLVIIYSKEHKGHWLTLDNKHLNDVVKLWGKSTQRAQKLENIVYSHIFENDGPNNTMTHPHGQQYNFTEIPPFIESEMIIAKNYYQKTNKNLYESIIEAELSSKARIVTENKHFIAFVPVGAKWPYQIRIIPKRRINWIFEFTQEEDKSLVDIINVVRKAYNAMYSGAYKPTIMMNILQSPLDKENENIYRKVHGLRIEFFNTALSQNAEKLMFSLENSLGLVAYSNLPENTAEEIRGFIK